MSSCNTVMESFAVRVTRDVYLSETVDALIVSFRLHFFCIDYSAGGGTIGGTIACCGDKLCGCAIH